MLKLGSALFNILLYILGALLVIFVLPKVLVFFMPFVIAWMMAVIANPLIIWLEKRISLRRKHSSAVIVVGVLFVILFILYVIVSRLVIFVGWLVHQMPTILSSVSASMSVVFEKLREFSDILPNQYRDNAIQMLVGLRDTLNGMISEVALPTFGYAGEIVKSLPSMLVYFVITLVSAYLFIAKRESLYHYVRERTPQSLRKYWNRFVHDVKYTIAGYLMAQLKLSALVMLVMVIGFWILGVKYAIWIAIAIAILDYLPIFGAGAVLIPWALMNVVNGEMRAGIGLLIIYAVTQILRQFLQPKLVGDSIGMPSLHTLFCLFLGFRLAGLGGMILAIPIGMLVMKLFEYGVFDSLMTSLRIIVGMASDFRKRGLHTDV